MAEPAFQPQSAMVLAAGLGLRMRPLTLERPKPLLAVAGRSLLDHALDRVAEAGIERAVVNAHYKAEMIEAALAGRTRPALTLSLEPQALETGGAIKQALPLLGDEPFLVVNADILWLDGPVPALRRLASVWDGSRMDGLLLLADMETELRRICDPQAMDALAKQDQRALIERLGGLDVAATLGAAGATPAPQTARSSDHPGDTP